MGLETDRLVATQPLLMGAAGVPQFIEAAGKCKKTAAALTDPGLKQILNQLLAAKKHS